MRYRLMELNRRLKNPDYAQQAWSQQEFPEPPAPGGAPQQPQAQGGGAPGANALQSFLAQDEGDFDASRLDSLEGQPQPAMGSTPPTLDRFAEALKSRRKTGAGIAQKMRGELTYD